MKQLTLFFTFFLSVVLLSAQEGSVPDFNTLKQGDWFDLEFTDDLNSGNFLFTSDKKTDGIPVVNIVSNSNFEFNYFDESFAGELWNPDSLLKFTFKSTVIKREDKKVFISVKISRIQYSLMLKLYNKIAGCRYYDSYYPFITGKNDNQKDIYKVNTDSIVYAIDTKTGDIIGKEYFFTNDTVRFKRYFVKDGILSKQLNKTLKIEYFIATKELFKKTVSVYFKIWKHLYSDNDIKENPSSVWLFKKLQYVLEHVNGFKNIYVDKVNKSWFSVTKESTMPMVFYIYKYHFLSPKYLQGKVIRVTAASFALPPNVEIHCSLKNIDNKKDSVRLLMEDKTYKTPEVINDSMFLFKLFLKNPELARLNFNGKNITIALTPGDSLLLNINTKTYPKEVKIRGKGSAICNYIYERDTIRLRLIGQMMRIYGTHEISGFKNKIDSVRELHLNLLDKYKDSLSLFWQKKELKNINYWYINEFMSYNEFELFVNKRFHEKFKEVDVPWDKSFIETLNPSVDYLYHSEEHMRFILLYSKYKQKQLLSVNAALESIDLKEQYTLNKIIYSGYPMYLAMTYNLVTLLVQNSNSIEKVNDFYNEFISYCEDPLFVKVIKEVYENINSVQPGKNIKDIDLYFTDKLNLQKVATSYILFSVSDFKHTNVILSLLNPVFKKYGLNNVSIVIVRPYSQKQTDKLKTFKGDVSFYYSSQDSIVHDSKKLLTLKNEMILIRNDGVIISNRISDFEKTFSKLPNRPPAPDLTGYYKVIFTVFISVLFAVLITIFSIRFRNVRILKKEEAKRRLAELELKAIRSQMNPHFMFNSLNSIQNLINKNKIKEANLYLSRFANMMRMVLNNSDKPLVPLDEELRLIKTYLELEQLRIQFQYNINISGEITTEEEEIPGMLIQPFVENAVIHGVAPNRGGNITVDISKKDFRLKIEISDDGIGINERSAQKGNGKAMKMVEERIKILNSRNRIPLTVDVIDLKEAENGLGTKVIITIPV